MFVGQTSTRMSPCSAWFLINPCSVGTRFETTSIEASGVSLYLIFRLVHGFGVLQLTSTWTEFAYLAQTNRKNSPTQRQLEFRILTVATEEKMQSLRGRLPCFRFAVMVWKAHRLRLNPNAIDEE